MPHHTVLSTPPSERRLWNAERAAAAYADGWWVRSTLADKLAAAAHATPHRVLVTDGDLSLTCADCHGMALRLAHNLLAHAPPRSIISFMLPNWYEAAVIYHAATLAGMIAHPILPSLRDHDLGFLLRDSGSRFIFIPEHFGRTDYAAMLARVVEAMDSPPRVAVLRGDPGPHMRFDDLLGPVSPSSLPTLDPDDIQMMLYTSGTTGRPKGVLHSHNSLHALIRQIGRHWLVEPGDRFLVPSPISHIGGSIYAFECPLLLETTAVLMDRWNPGRAVEIAQDTPWTHMAGATPFLEQLLAAADAAGTDLPALKVFICGGASVPPSLIRTAARRFSKARVSRVYGSTETPVATVGALQVDDRDRAAETDGRPGVADVKIVEHPDATPGDGEILVRGPQMLVGYLRPEDEDGAFDQEGYFTTGDIGRICVDGTLTVTGRAKDIIIRHGENISAKEVEDALAGHPRIAEVAVVGVPDPKTGEQACAVIVPRPGATPDLDDIASFLKHRGLARFKTPERLVLTDSLPRNDAGKVLKHLLRQELVADIDAT